MLFILALLLGLVIGWLRGGHLKGLVVEIHGLLFALTGLVLQGGITYWSGIGFIPDIWVAVLHLLSFMFLLYFLWLNRSHPGWKIIAAGVALNFLVIAANGGAMPVDSSYMPVALARPLQQGVYLTYVAINEGTRLWFLGDVLTLPNLRPSSYSVGDALILIGLFYFIQQSIALLPRVLSGASSGLNLPSRGVDDKIKRW
ncbi:MAG: DUF5317 domain-containing protein [Bacillota bacterium]